MLSKITDCFAAEKLNILQQINHSRGPIAYNVVDIDTSGHDDVLGLKKVQEQITMLDGVLSSRIIYGWPGSGLAKNLEGQYYS
jgi:D-3-phosphoglycerate dehydrogenase / 2-oxoglutarate reductase